MESEPPKKPDLPDEKTGSDPDQPDEKTGSGPEQPVEKTGYETDDDDVEEILNESNLSQIRNVVNENKIK